MTGWEAFTQGYRKGQRLTLRDLIPMRLKRRAFARWRRHVGGSLDSAAWVNDNANGDGVAMIRYLRCARMCNDLSLPPYRRQMELAEKRHCRDKYLRSIE